MICGGAGYTKEIKRFLLGEEASPKKIRKRRGRSSNNQSLLLRTDKASMGRHGESSTQERVRNDMDPHYFLLYRPIPLGS